MPPHRRVLLLTTASALVLAGCTPGPPDEVESAAEAVRALPGVADVAVTRTFGPEPVQGNFGQRSEAAPSTVSVEVALTAALDPHAAGEAAASAHRLLAGAARDVDETENVTVTSDFVGSGLSVRAGPNTAADIVVDAVEDGYDLLAAGATTVGLGLGEGNGSDPLAATAHVAAAAPDDLVDVAEAADELDRRVELEAPGARYRSAASVPDVDTVRLLVAAAGQPGVQDATYLAQERRLTLQSDAESGAQSLADLRRWLEARDFATVDAPVAYTVLDAGYAETTGWVSGAEPAPRSPGPAGGATPWPDDPAALDCTGQDLEVTLGVVDSAAGTRGVSVRARNVSGQPCALKGVPDLVFENAAGQPQPDVTVQPSDPRELPARVVVPDGGAVLALLLWHTMSTANDPDTTTTVQVTPVPGADPVPLDATTDGTPATGLDVLDGAEVRVGPWMQGD
ncbi:DUF4232 domain-containing protein [Promicromonospora sp. NPDC090134]|uniref:DUF4232 domain-containing protein n=1 Tax=Promicromonospora sp. NPDC090134 TaxID=3364408 RepID=UPI0038022351